MNGKKCPTADARPGMKLAASIIKESGQVILAEGTVLTDTFIEKLKLLNLEFVEIAENTAEEAPTPLASVETFDAVYDDTLQVIDNCFSTMRYFKEVPLMQMKELADTSIDLMADTTGVLSYLQIVRKQDDYTFRHSINVAIISGIVGKWVGMSGEELKDLIFAGLLHDIGKTQIPLEILNKPAKLTPEEMKIMKNHTIKGYKMLLGELGAHESILCGVLQHHEKIDGTGYPFGISGEQIHPFAKIIAVADIYDAMTSDRVYHIKRTPFEVIEEIKQETFGKLDPAICITFLRNILNYFMGAKVLLSDGEEAEIIYQRNHAYPTVCTRDGKFIDLEINRDISIVGFI
ncbi:MAG TPA: HD-GYP domain-containing protein [Methylomusa anaerophila]|uniref:Cyclic di-GMP phosphodiesterase response regulator RpfG n=1 Tax=Methylomusa anaerophila TaxID=1930071 RepID=A0A348AIL9_9FIRM|nr:HD-GYP domain-containing protein [Methylomusa anaerophila]BBB90917.1 cyclic di-GMP phosphodiesterase response regulator RpfG [Methylomusa anaerophila]HML90679.1 HD-GYP domain-containing protein [Methylomusa anaerophila]